MADKSKTNPQQIMVCKTNRALIEALDHLHVPETENNEPYAAMHGKYSRICLKMCNYADKDNSVTVLYNIAPHLADYFLEMFPLCISDFSDGGFSHTESKMLQHKKNPDGTVLVTKFIISRMAATKTGEPRKCPWTISIENGKGVPKAGQNGTSYFTNYQKEREAVISLSDVDFFLFTQSICVYVRLWENTFVPKLIREETMRVAEQQRIERQAT